MTKPRVRIDREGWIRNDQPWPFGKCEEMETKWSDGVVLDGWYTITPDELIVCLGMSVAITHYRIVG
jgi:hypothetical protein